MFSSTSPYSGFITLLATAMFLLLGLVLLFIGGEALVRGGVSLAGRLGLSPLVIGLTVVGFGTSMPEFVVSVDAALLGLPDIAVGNIVGSNTANILLILGASVLIMPMSLRMSQLSRDFVIMILAALVMLILGYEGNISRLSGGLMLISLIAYLIYVTKFSTVGEMPPVDAMVRMNGMKEFGLIVGGLAALMIGADFLVDASTTIARSFEISEATIGLTIVAIGTSLPELATSLVAAIRRHSDVAIGNVIGSNIFNILGILGVTAIITPVTITAQFAQIDIPIMLAISIILVAVVYLLGNIGRLVGTAFLTTYAVYLGFLF